MALTVGCADHQQSLSSAGPSPLPSRGLQGTQNGKHNAQHLQCECADQPLKSHLGQKMLCLVEERPGLSTQTLPHAVWAGPRARQVNPSYLLAAGAQKVSLLSGQPCARYFFVFAVPTEKEEICKKSNLGKAGSQTKFFLFSRERDLRPWLSFSHSYPSLFFPTRCGQSTAHSGG